MVLRFGIVRSVVLVCCVATAACSKGSEDGDDGAESGGSSGASGKDGADGTGELRDVPGKGGAGSLLPLGGSSADGGAAQSDAGTAGAGETDAGEGSGGSGSGGSSGGGDSGSGGTGGDECEDGAFQCASDGRERCDGGDWVADACPLDTPACVDDECVLRGPEMIKVSTFYIDSTEVTVADYNAFLADKDDDISGQPEVCAWNLDYVDGTPEDPDTWPITYVDWCDARAYCDWAGKRLCGAREGGAVAPDDSLDETKSQWFLACGSGGSHPNGSADCNSGGSGLDAVGTNLDCEGYYPGLFDMEGNAAEWVDSCVTETGRDDICYLLGGSFYDNQSYCTESYAEYPRDDVAGSFGFRCCSG